MELLSTGNMENENRILALDIGEKRVGTAISDPLGYTAQPGPTLDRKPEEQFWRKLEELLATWSVRRAVVGLPIGLGGQKTSPSYIAVMEFLRQAQQKWPEIEWKTWDERLTTTQAIQILSAAPGKKRRDKSLRDQIAAQLILDSYLRSPKGRSGV
ncbi:MAG: Holliday junction resolvase RuvX [Candidatus Omnitrophica bacterium]|nr:Holliday junction resolvase RuvX [Candidatus Omnitrophota bacterium]